MKKIVENNLEKPLVLFEKNLEHRHGITVKWSWSQYGDVIRITSRADLPANFGAKAKEIETHRMFRFEGERPQEEQMLEQLERAGQDLIDKLGFIWQANHGMLDSELGTIRFNT